MVTKHRQLLKLRACCAKGPMSLDIAINAHPTVFILYTGSRQQSDGAACKICKVCTIVAVVPFSLSFSFRVCVCMLECDSDSSNLLGT